MQSIQILNKIDERETMRKLNEYDESYLLPGGTELFSSSPRNYENDQKMFLNKKYNDISQSKTIPLRPAFVPPLNVKAILPCHFRDYGDTVSHRPGSGEVINMLQEAIREALSFENQSNQLSARKSTFRTAYIQSQMIAFYSFLLERNLEAGEDEDFVDILEVILARLSESNSKNLLDENLDTEIR